MYRLDELAAFAAELGLECCRVDANGLEVRLPGEAVLVFYNLVEEDDTLVGFEGTPWHAHGVVLLMTGPDTSVACDEFDILVGLQTGELVVVSEYAHGELKDRWLAHRKEALDLEYLGPGEEFRVARVDG